MARPFFSLRRFFGIALFLVLSSVASLGAAQISLYKTSTESLSDRSSSGQEITAEELFSKLVEQNQAREIHLKEYSESRTYAVSNDKGKLHAQTVVSMQFRAPGTKTFTTNSEEGSWVVRRLVFKRLMESEVETAAGRSHRDSSIRPDNYTFRLLGTDDVGAFHCYVVQAVPRRRDKYLFEGQVWIDAQDFAVVKIAGHPAKNPSFWIKRVDFVRQFQKVGEFWLSERDQSINELRIHGTKVLTIDHRDYRVNGGQATNAHP